MPKEIESEIKLDLELALLHSRHMVMLLNATAGRWAEHNSLDCMDFIMIKSYFEQLEYSVTKLRDKIKKDLDK